jgi:hypothetical protein
MHPQKIFLSALDWSFLERRLFQKIALLRCIVKRYIALAFEFVELRHLPTPIVEGRRQTIG